MSKNDKKGQRVNPYKKNDKTNYPSPLFIALGIIVTLIIIISIVIATGGNNKSASSGSQSENSNQSTTSSQSENQTQSRPKPDVSGESKIIGADTTLLQFSEMKDGEEIAIMTVKDFGDIKIRFFKEQAPKAVENFLTHSQKGYYNGLTFHRVMNDFMIQGGDPKGTGTGGESIWGKAFNDEFSDKLFNFRGALSMANSGPNTNGSQFFIVQSPNVPANQIQSKDAKVVETYKKIGGTPWLDGKHTVFGQVFEGMNIVDAIAKEQTGANDKPVYDVIIEKITVTNYKK